MSYERIRDSLTHSSDLKLGFVVYRCTYDSQDECNFFMKYLDSTIHVTLREADLGDMVDRLDWNVQEDPDLDDATFDTVRRDAYYNRIATQVDSRQV